MMKIFQKKWMVWGLMALACHADAMGGRKAESMEKPRVVVLTDIAPCHIEPDDMESMVRLLVHADLLEIEAIIATGGWNSSGRDYPVGWMDSLYACLDAYGKDLPNLMRRSGQDGFLPLADEGKVQKVGYWPSLAYLRSRTMLGSKGLGVARIGEKNDSEGSERIIRLLQEKDERPLWILAWGGANTLAQALWRMQRSYAPEKWKGMVEKLRVYTITDQDVGWGERKNHLLSSHYWMRKEFGKSLYFIWDESAWLTQNEIGSRNWGEYAKHVQGHGCLGRLYPKNKWGVEGDTPSFLHVLPVGLNDPSVPTHVGWGGFFRWGASADGETSCYTNIDPKVKAASRKYEEYFYQAVFNNFAARMDWAEDGKGNRNPVAYVGKDGRHGIISLAVKAGKTLVLDASRSYDPDGDSLRYRWWILPEAGTYRNPVGIEGADTDKATIRIPADLGKDTVHLILEVSDDGSPNLTSYRRVVLRAR